MKKWIRVLALMIGVCMLTGAGAEGITLKTLFDADSKVGKLLLAAHPDVTLVEPADYYMSTTEIYQAILTGEYEGDVIPLDTAYHNVQPLMEKGYLLDLSSSELIRDAVDRLYPALRELLTCDGKIYGVPNSVYFTFYAINAEAWEVAGMSDVPVPDTLDQLFDCIEIFCDKLEDEEFDQRISVVATWDATVYTESSYAQMFTEWIIGNYIMQLKYAGSAMTFDAETLLPLLNRARELGDRLYQAEPHLVTDESQGLGLLEAYSSTTNTNTEEHPIVFMRISEDQPKLIHAQLNMWSAYGQTEYPDLCIELLEDVLKTQDAFYAAYLYTDSEPVIRSSYDAEVAQQQAFVQETQEMLQNPDLDWAEKQDLTDRLEKQQRILDDLFTSEDAKYEITPAVLTAYQETIGNCLYFEEPNFFTSTGSEGTTLETLEKQFAAGVLDADHFIAELNRVANMIQAEEGAD